ncbi:MAG: glycosyltransferase family 2 protein [Lachnospiraceae bacterium]|nr:glycosyltransferase family 2 protein [Lachnospiraceae bacterium]
MDTLFIVIPAYNEEENIKQVIDDWYPIIEMHNENGMSRLLIIDDGSKDNTYKKVCECADSRPFLIPITKSNSGHGATLLWGYHYALEHGADFVFQTDSDGQTLPSEFELFWKLRNEYDMVIGWRRYRQDGISRVFVTKVLKLVIKFCFHVTVQDANTPFRLMKEDKLKEYIALIPEDFNLSNVLLSVIYARKNCKVKYIPITFRKRQGGTNSIDIIKILKIGRKALKDFQILNKKI